MDCVLPESELDLLAKLEEANRQIETDSRSLNSLVNHSRRDSDSWFSNDSTTNNNNVNNSTNTSIGVVSMTTNSSDKSLTISSKNGDCLDEDNVVNGDAGADTNDDDNDNDDEETHSWQQWGELVSDWQTNWKRKRAQITTLIRRNGIPHHFRALVWQLLCQIDSETPERKSYANYIRARSACEKVIRRDIARTYPEHEFFKEKDGVGQESLFNVMKAYSLYDREVGYCQGSAFIVGLLLMQMPEEETFAVLVHIMQKYRMRDMFKPSMAELGLCMFQLECLVQEQLPQLYLHFKSQNFHTTMYASGWFLTLFTTTLSLPLACRVMDVFLVDGMQIIFQISLALLTIGERDLIVRDMEGMLQYFQKDLPAIVERDEDGGTRLMRMASEIVWNSRKMRKLEKEYQTLKIKEQQEVLELKRLRTEVRQWRQRCELLEAESARLAQRLIQGQVSRAEEVEMTFTLETELSKLRNERLDMMHNLEMAYEEIRMLSMRLQETLSSQLSSVDECNSSSPSLSTATAATAATTTTVRTSQENLKTIESKPLSNGSTDLVTCLQDELVKVRLREAENDEMIRDLQAKIDELESEIRLLREPRPDNNLARIQEELMAVKLREAESNLSLKDLRERIDELRCQWHNMLNERNNGTGSGCLSAHEQLEDNLMSAKLNEIAAIGEVKELNLKVIQLESQVQLTANQFRRQSDELKKFKDDLDESQKREEQLDSDLKRQRFAYADLESCLNEHRIQAGISSAEKDQQIAELKQCISQLELKNDEMVAESELNQNSLEQNEQICDLQDKVVELKAQIISLQMHKKMSIAADFTTKPKQLTTTDLK